MRSRATLKQGEATEHHQDYLSKAHAPLKEGITAWLLRHRGKPGVWSASESPRFGVTSLRATSRAAGIAVAHMLGWGQIAENGVGVDDPRWNSNPLEATVDGVASVFSLCCMLFAGRKKRQITTSLALYSCCRRVGNTAHQLPTS